jgi:hypothetical protein
MIHSSRPDTSVQRKSSSMLTHTEEERRRFKVELKDTTKALEKYSGELSDLVINFAGIV